MEMLCYLHTSQLSVIGTESPSFSSRQYLRPRRLKSPSFEHRLFSSFFSFSGHHFVFSSYNPDYNWKIWLFVRNELIRISCNALASICSWPKRKLNMLLEKIAKMVKDIFQISKHNTIFIVSQCIAHPAMRFWQRGVFYEKSSEVIPSPCEHVSSNEDCSSRITNCR